MTDTTLAQIDAATGPQLVEMYNEMCATASELGLEHLGGKPLAEVTRFASLDAARRRCGGLHLEITRYRARVAKEDKETRALGTVKDLSDEDKVVQPTTVKGIAALVEENKAPNPVVAQAPEAAPVEETPAGVPPAKPAPSPKKQPKYTMASVIRPLAEDPYEVGTGAAEIFRTLRPGMTVREFCAAHGKYPRALNFLNPMVRDGAVELVTVLHGKEVRG